MNIGFNYFSGAQYIYQCPVERYIPIYLIVGGASWLIWQLFVWKPCKRKKKDKSTKKAVKAWKKAVKRAKKRSKAEAAEADGGEVTHGGSPVHVVVVASDVPASKEGEGTAAENGESSSSEDGDSTSCWETVLFCFIVAWFIAGNVWVYRTAPFWQGDTPLVRDYCDPTLYYFSFWLITGVYILLAAIITIMSAFNICK